MTACSTASPPPTYTLTNVDALPGWREDSPAAALHAFRASCVELMKLDPNAVVGKGALAAPAGDWQIACRAAARTSSPRAFFEANFTPFRIAVGEKDTGLFTGYYAPLLHGSLHRHGRYQTPVYTLPDDIKPGVPYFSRQEIDRGVLAGRGLEIAWVDDPASLFFLQIQGSGSIKLDSNTKGGGRTLRLAFAGKNNQPYVALGKVLFDAGEMRKDEINLFSLRQWLADHPDRAQEMMWKNPSYVFFRVEPAPGQPMGAQRVPLTPRRSLAVDPHFTPYGLPLFLTTQLPDGAGFSHIMVAQDTGGAIRGAIRGDIFFGSGEEAEENAGYMKAEGQLVALVPNAVAEHVR